MDQLYREVLRLLLASSTENGECCEDLEVVFRRLERRYQNLRIHNPNTLRQCLQRCPELFKLEDNRRQVTVSPATTLSVCYSHSNKSGSCREGSCKDLHFCIFFLLSGNCSFGSRCLFGHDLKTGHNQRLLQRHLLLGLNITELRILFCLPAVRQGITQPQICKYYNKSQGCSKKNSCHSLHMCWFYVLGQCKFVKRCDRVHDISDPQVKKVLSLYGIKWRRAADILRELRTYVSQRHDSGHCTDDEEDAPSRPIITGAGGAIPKTFGSVPDLSCGVRFSLPHADNDARQRCASISRQKNASESSYFGLIRGAHLTPKTEEICLFHLQGICRFKERCCLLHSSEPFMWRLTLREEQDEGEGEWMWSDLPSDSNLALEQAYSQPHLTSCVVTDEDGNELDVEFRHMTAVDKRTRQMYTVRRVSTPSSMLRSVKKRQGSTFATKWLWFWREQSNGSWQEFGMEEIGSLPVTSDRVEEIYLMSADTPMPFSHYILNFAKMKLKDTMTGHRFKVRRRPQLVLRNHDAESDDESDSDARDDEDTRSGTDEGRPSSDDDVSRGNEASVAAVPISAAIPAAFPNSVAVPIPAAVPISADYTLVQVLVDSHNFTEVKKRFTMTMGVKSTVLSIQRVINRQLAASYDRKKLLMTSSGRTRLQEIVLYYGPSQNEVNTVCSKGVDCNPAPRTYQKSDMFLGRGGYFYVNASQADRSNGKQKERHVFVMKCMVGTCTEGDPSFLVPPSLDPYNASGRRYDSCVDDVANPKTFVIFDASQVCPLYLITYYRG